MRYYKKLLVLLSLIFISCEAVAIKDPISQSVIPQSLPSTVKVGDSLSATYTLTNNKKYPVKLTIEKTTVGDGIITNDLCNGVTLAKKGDENSQCTINVSIDPVTPGKLMWKGVMHYDYNHVPLTTLSTVVENQTEQVMAGTDLDLPATTYLNNDPSPFTFRFTNSGSSDVTGNGQVTCNVSSYNIETNECLNKTLKPKDYCLITGNFSPLALGLARLVGSFNYNDNKNTASIAMETTVEQLTGQVIAESTVPLQNPTYVNQGPYSFEFEFTNNGPGDVTGNGDITGNAPAGTVTITNNGCTNKTLKINEKCSITGTFSPVATGNVTIYGNFSYNSSIASTSMDTTVQNISSQGIIAQTVVPLPPTTEPQSYPVTFRFTNASGIDLKVSQDLSLPNVTSITDTCPTNGGTFSHTSPSNVCTISGTFTPAESAQIQTLTATMTATGAASATASTSTRLNSPSNRPNFTMALWPKSLRVSADAKDMPYQFAYQINSNTSDADQVMTINFINPTTVQLVEQAPTHPPDNPNDNYFKSYYNCQSASTSTGNIPFDPNQNLTVTLPKNPGGICNIYVSFLVTSTEPPNAYTDNFSIAFVAPTGFPDVVTPLSYATGNQIITNGVPLTRTLTFTNHCSYDVWYALHGASIQGKNKSSVACTKDSECFNGSFCGKGECEWIQPTPTNGYYLAANGGTTRVIIPVYDNAIKLALNAARDIAWGGNLAGRAGCSGSGSNASCIVNDCGPDPDGGIGKCSLGIGSPRAPISASEFTLQSDDPLIYSNQIDLNEAVDNYNIQLIDGVTVPSTMAPANATYNPSTPYSCGGAGLKTVQPSSQLKSCPWTFTQNTPSDYLWVQYNANHANTPCTDNTSCTTPGDICGLMVNPTGDARVKKACGQPIISGTNMYWTADAVCKIDSTFGAPFNCSSPVSSISGNVNTGTIQILHMYGCTGQELAVSCYNAGATNQCCGCINWGSSIAPVTTEQCTATNLGWTNQVTNLITWIKEGCPTAYSYPYDDPSSSFTCLVDKTLTIPTDSYDGDINTTNYNIDFCPQ